MFRINDDTDAQHAAMTACGWVTPAAAGDAATVLAAGTLDVAPVDGRIAVPDGFRDLLEKLPNELKRDRAGWMTALAFERCLASGGLALDDFERDRVGLAMGAAWAGPPGMITFAEEVRDQTARFVSPIHFPQTVGNYIAGALARGYGLRGPSVTLASGVASGFDAVLEGLRWLQTGEADLVIAGGFESWDTPMARHCEDGDDARAEGACLLALQRVADIEAPFAWWLDPAGEADATARTIDLAQPDRGSAPWSVVGGCASVCGPAAVACLAYSDLGGDVGRVVCGGRSIAVRAAEL